MKALPISDARRIVIADLPPALIAGGGRRFGAFNWTGFTTLYLKEVRRFLSMPGQTLAAPVVTTLLFFAIFDIAIARQDYKALGLDYEVFLAPGLIMMAIVQGAFLNSSFSLIIAKVQGVIVDLLMPPLTSFELVTAQTLGGVTRGLMVGLLVGGAMALVIPFSAPYPWMALFYVLSAAFMLTLAGLITGALSEKFDHIAGLLNFVVTPLAFLSGTFYTLDQLPPLLKSLAFFSPFFHLINGFREGMTGVRDGDALTSLIVVSVVNLALFVAALSIFKFGVRLKN